MVLAGVIAYSTGNGVKDEDEEAARKLLSGCGSVYKVAESGMNAVSAISGCGPLPTCLRLWMRLQTQG